MLLYSRYEQQYRCNLYIMILTNGLVYTFPEIEPRKHLSKQFICNILGNDDIYLRFKETQTDTACREYINQSIRKYINQLIRTDWQLSYTFDLEETLVEFIQEIIDRDGSNLDYIQHVSQR